MTARSTAKLYDRDGTTFIQDVATIRIGQWTRALSAVGGGSFSIPLADAGPFTDNRIVKFYRGTQCVQGLILKGSTVQHAVDGTVWKQFDSQPDVNALLAEGVVLPEYGLRQRSADKRWFGFMSKQDPAWYVSADWVTPNTLQWSADTGIRKGKPADFKTDNPYWLAFAGLYDTIPNNASNYFRQSFTLAADTTLNFIATADNDLWLYLDGEEIINPSAQSGLTWRAAAQVSVTLTAGTHLLAAKASNVPLRPGWGGQNPVAFVMVAQKLNAAGDKTGVELISDSSWLAHGPTAVGWHRGHVLYQLVTEAQAAGFRGPSLLSLGFTKTADSDGIAFTDYGEFSFDVGMVNLADVATQLAEAEFDWMVNPGTMALEVRNRWGQDRSATVALATGPNGSLISYETQRTAPGINRLYTQASDGQWRAINDTSAQSAAGGVIAGGLALGSTSAGESVTALANTQFADVAVPHVSMTAQPSTLTGPQLFADYFLGDSITVPDHDAGTRKARVLAITVNESSEVVQQAPELKDDPT